MALPKGTMTFTLTDEEVETLLNLNLKDQPGEELHKQVCDHLSGGNRDLPINEPQLGRMFRAMVWGAGPIQYMAAKIFKRSLMEMVTREE
jgi:hypothetical protein